MDAKLHPKWALCNQMLKSGRFSNDSKVMCTVFCIHLFFVESNWETSRLEREWRATYGQVTHRSSSSNVLRNGAFARGSLVEEERCNLEGAGCACLCLAGWDGTEGLNQEYGDNAWEKHIHSQTRQDIHGHSHEVQACLEKTIQKGATIVHQRKQKLQKHSHITGADDDKTHHVSYLDFVSNICYHLLTL